MRNILLFLIITPLACTAQPFTADLLNYTGNIFRQVATGKVTVYDSLMRKLPADRLYIKYVSAMPHMADNINNNYYTKNSRKEADIVSAFHYGFFEGVMGLPDLPAFLFDTVAYKPNKNYIAFRQYNYTDVGTLKNKQTLFIINRNPPVVSKSIIQKRAQTTAMDSANKQKAKLLTTLDNEYWAINGFWIGNKKDSLDMCQSKYKLKLASDRRFNQYYTDTADFTINRKAGVDTGIERAFYFVKEQEHVQCYMENESGIWTVYHNRLILFSSYGITISNYSIRKLSKDRIELQLKNYKLVLSKRHQ